MFEKEARKWVKENTKIDYKASYGEFPIEPSATKSFKAGAEFGYNKANEEMQKQDYSLFDFVMQYENGKFKCEYKSGKVFESIDGETWKEIVLPKEIK